MDKQSDSKKKSAAGYRKPKGFHMAYSLNNHQPVLCTMISDQPFFYMDEELVFEEDSIMSGLEDSNFNDLNAADLKTLEVEITKLKDKMMGYDAMSDEFALAEDSRLQLFIENAAAFSDGGETLSHASLEDIIATLEKSRMANELLACATQYGVALILSHQTSKVSYDKKGGKILINPDLNHVDQILLSVQELRRHWQHRQGALVHPLTFHPDQAVLINRAQMADLSVSVIRCAWEYKLLGMNEMWSRIENSSMADLGRALGREALSDFRTLNNGKAAAAVFETWFLSERCRHQDKKLIQAMLADYRGYVFDHAEASKMISIDLVCALGEQPFGKNYLSPYANMILNDPVFTDIRDRANANFLWFIKFEREFQEIEAATPTKMEHELQSSNVIKTSGIDLVNNKDIIEDTQNEQPFQRYENTLSADNVISVDFAQPKLDRETTI